MKIKIFGPNLRDQSKGQFVVHSCTCNAARKLEMAGETMHVQDVASATALADDVYSDQIREGSMTSGEGLQDFHFCPCVATLPTDLPVA